jgi:large repetitive protein
VNLKNADVSGMDFGNKGNLSISGMKYYDLNGNGVQDKDEPGIPGQTVTLLDNGKEIATATTGQDGGYTFNNLVQGTYNINDPTSGGFVLTTTSSITVTITSSAVLHASFGLTGTHSISGVKFNDVNGNGVMDSGEPGVPGWGMVLDGTTAFHGIHITRTVNTASDGSYAFDHLVPGTYKISELSRPGWTQTVPSGVGSKSIIKYSARDDAASQFQAVSPKMRE